MATRASAFCLERMMHVKVENMTIEAVTVGDLYRKLGHILRNNPNVDKAATILGASVVTEDNDDEYPKGSVLFTCRCEGEREGRYHILSIHPDRLNKYLC